MSKISLIFYWVFFAVLNLKASEYEITVLATNTANFGGIGEWSFSALLESDDEKILLGFYYEDIKINPKDIYQTKYIEPDENFVRIFVPGSMPPGTINDWGPNEGGFISPDAPSIMTFNQYLNCYEKTYTLTEGLEYTYKFHIHYDSTGNDHAWIHDPLNPELDDNMWQDNLLSVTDPLIFQQKRFVTNGYDVDRFDVGIHT